MGTVPPQVRVHVCTWSHVDVSPFQLATMVNRSQGAIRRSLIALTAAGTVTRTRQRPARFRITA
ncbi:hypothetical protein [Micromonospora sp. 067-2]|uniref:hypothetical protein n=1 Tax=Micromonospora sp. 067-2 TaxID=2789270 RepID=UPI00397C9406